MPEVPSDSNLLDASLSQLTMDCNAAALRLAVPSIWCIPNSGECSGAVCKLFLIMKAHDCNIW